ncbi:MAG: stage V sporulation protein AC [Clostridia bacterium]|nr:stage V sporulation protein AC [Clostridia bacterium]
MTGKEYRKYAERHAPRSPLLNDCAMAFLFGGTVCVIGQLIKNSYLSFGIDEETAGTLDSATLIFAAVLLTGIGVFDDIARIAGAGVLLPITGFANAVASPAIDSRTEGYVLGVGAKIFTVAGPVLLYGTASGAVYGIVYFIVRSLT